MNGTSPEMIELFLQEASEHLQFLREYSGILQDPYPLYEDIERLYISAHGVAGTSGTYGYPLFHEVASKLAHIFQYAMNATISPEATGPLVEFIYEAIAVLESDLIMISANAMESAEDIAAFKHRFPFAFQAAPETEAAPELPNEAPAVSSEAPHAQHAHSQETAGASAEAPVAEPAVQGSAEDDAAAPLQVPPVRVQPEEKEGEAAALVGQGPAAESTGTSTSQQAPTAGVGGPAAIVTSPVTSPATSAAPHATPESLIEGVPELEPDEEIPAEVLEFFVPEVEEHLQTITDCLLALEANPSEEEIHRLFRSMHTIKGSAAQVG